MSCLILGAGKISQLSGKAREFVDDGFIDPGMHASEP